jgi:arginyl-tRNA synthetase
MPIDDMLYVVGADQAQHFEQLFATLGALGYCLQLPLIL